MDYKFRVFYPKYYSMDCKTCDTLSEALETKRGLMTEFSLADHEVMIFNDRDRLDTYVICEPMLGYYKELNESFKGLRMMFTTEPSAAWRFVGLDAARQVIKDHGDGFDLHIRRFNPSSRSAGEEVT